jgi:hypothetical protein
MLGSFGLCSLQGIISLAQPILQHLNVGPWHGTIIVGHDYSLSEALDNGFPQAAVQPHISPPPGLDVAAAETSGRETLPGRLALGLAAW